MSGLSGYLIFILGGFLSGSMMFSQILPQLLQEKDMEAISDDHNPGATNVFINCGAALGVICLLLDMGKGFLPVFLACQFVDRSNLLYGLVLAAPVLGHAIAPFHHFHGGKCIATTFGVMIALLPINPIGLVLAVVYILFSTLFKIQSNRVRSLLAFGIFGIVSFLHLVYVGEYSVALGCILISGIAMIKHSKYFVSKSAITTQADIASACGK